MSAERLSRRKFLALSGMVAGGAALAACAPAVPAPAAAPGAGEPAAASTELVHWAEGILFSEVEPHVQYQNTVRELYKDMYPNVTIKWENQGWDEVLRQNLTTALLAGTGPDIIVGENFFQQYADLGTLVAVDEQVEDIKDNLIPGTYQAAVTQGKVYGINQFTGIFGFERNPNVIEKAGLDPTTAPATWDDLLEQAEMITTAGNGEYYGYTLQGPLGFSVGGIFRVAVYMKQAGADMTNEDGTQPWFDNPAAEPVLDFLRKINRFTPPGLTFNPDEGQVYSQLFQGISAYQICGSWHVNWAKDSGLENAMYSAIPIPKDGKKASIVVGNVINAVLEVSEHKEEAAALCKLFTVDEIQDLVYPAYGRLPSTRTALTKLRPNASEADQAFIDDVLTADLGVLPQWRKDPNKLWTIYNELLTGVLSTEDPLDTLMGNAQAQAEEVMAAA
jgi:ABC-type glycerol-3-phosphate transport system substrate-binding protein